MRHWLLLVILAGCRRERAAPTATEAHDAGPPPPWVTEVSEPEPSDTTMGRGIVYDCTGAPEPKCAATMAPALVRLLHAADRSLGGGHHGPTAEERAEDGAAISEVSALDPSTLSLEHRVIAQSNALRIAGAVRTDDKALFARAVALVDRLSLSAVDLIALGTEPMASLDAWLGARATWVEKNPFLRPLMHESVFRNAMSFRAVGQGPLRAIFGQYIAIDRDGRAHVTPFVGEIELRRGTFPSARACVITRSACGLSAVASASALPTAAFFIARPEGRTGCPTCHGPAGSPFDLAAYKGPFASDLAARRKSLFERTATGLQLP